MTTVYKLGTKMRHIFHLLLSFASFVADCDNELFVVIFLRSMKNSGSRDHLRSGNDFQRYSKDSASSALFLAAIARFVAEKRLRNSNSEAQTPEHSRHQSVSEGDMSDWVGEANGAVETTSEVPPPLRGCTRGRGRTCAPPPEQRNYRFDQDSQSWTFRT